MTADSGPDWIEIDLELRDAGSQLAESGDWLAELETALPSAVPATAPEPPPARGAAAPPEPPAAPAAPALVNAPAYTKLPLFTPALDEGGDEPLVKLPPTPRPPLAVRRTPDTPRLRAAPPAIRRTEPEPPPSLQFEAEDGHHPPVVRRPRSRVWTEPEPRRPEADAQAAISPSGARLAAAAIDHLMLFGIDLTVVYFTLRMAGLPMEQWTTLPPAPLVAFLLLIKLSYFWAFTAVGGQTIGKMAARIRVVGADNRPVDAALAVRRTLAGVLSAALFGLGFLPALVGADRRALHDRVARTRVIALRSA
ncbi:MAG: RDD family protein [Acidobacteria bacterium]|nr:RDD family protein [Acidobacteriota bacterium]